MKVYLVTGFSGTHDDYTHWTLLGFFDKESARLLQIDCERERDRIKEEIKNLKKKHSFTENVFEIEDPIGYWDEYTKIVETHKFDPNFEFNEDNCGYYIQEIEVKGEPPKIETEN